MRVNHFELLGRPNTDRDTRSYQNPGSGTLLLGIRLGRHPVGSGDLSDVKPLPALGGLPVVQRQIPQTAARSQQSDQEGNGGESHPRVYPLALLLDRDRRYLSTAGMTVVGGSPWSGSEGETSTGDTAEWNSPGSRTGGTADFPFR